MKVRRIAYHMPYPTTIYAHRYIFEGFKNAFKDMGHEFYIFTPDDDLEEFLETYKPDLFITASHFFYRKSLDYNILKKYREKGMVLLTKIDFWTSPINKNRINEAPSMKDDKVTLDLIMSEKLGDYYFSTSSQNDGRMKGFTEYTGKTFITIPLAADKISLIPAFDKKFESDIAFLGTNLPQKRKFFKEWLFPLGQDYKLKLYGQDWNFIDKYIGMATKVGQYFNIPYLKSLQKPKLQFGDEAKIYSSAKISVNLHEDYQREFGGDCNERTFKIPLCGGFEISDDVSVIREYFVEDKEIIIAKDKEDWFKKIKYFTEHPDEAREIAKAGQRRALKDHTYHNRAQQMLDLLLG